MVRQELKHHQETPDMQEDWEEVNELREQALQESRGLYTEQDLRKWKHGARKFHGFESQTGFLAKMETLKQPNVSKAFIGQMQALFLGEKSVIFGEETKLLSIKEKQVLEESGFKIIGTYIYNPKQVKIVVEQNLEDFKVFNSSVPEEIMKLLSSADNVKFSVPRGLLLGFPKESILKYEENNHLKIDKILVSLHELLSSVPSEQSYLESECFTDKIHGNRLVVDFVYKKLNQYKDQLNISDADMPKLLEEFDKKINTKAVNIHGLQWVDFGYSKESKIKQARLKVAFESSGILGQS